MTLNVPNYIIYQGMVNLWDRDNLQRKDKRPATVSKVSFVWRFDCTPSDRPGLRPTIQHSS